MRHTKSLPFHIALLLAALLLGACGDESKVQPNTVNIGDLTSDRPSQISYNTSMTFSSAGLLRAILHAGRIQTFEAKRYTLLDSSVKVDFYDKLGKHSSILTSRSARIDNNSNNMTAYGKVHIVSDSGTVVDTDSLQWTNSSQTLHSNSAVRIAEKNGRITTGVGFQSDQSLTHYSILQPTIEAPSNVFQPGSPGGSNPSLRPQTPAVPGSGGLMPPPGLSTSIDTVKK